MSCKSVPRRQAGNEGTWELRVCDSKLLSFPAAAATVWNTLPVHVQSSPSIATFSQRLKTFLFQQSFPDNAADIVIVCWLINLLKLITNYVTVDFIMAIAILATFPTD